MDLYLCCFWTLIILVGIVVVIKGLPDRHE